MFRYPEGDLLTQVLPRLPQRIASELGESVVVLPMVGKLDHDIFYRLMKHLSTRKEGEDILCIFDSSGGNRGVGEKIIYALNAQLADCKIVSLALGDVCSTAFDIWLGVNNPDRRFCSTYTRFLAHNSTHNMTKIPGKINLVDRTFEGLTPKQIGRKLEKECEEILERESAMAETWNKVARKMGYPSGAEFLRAEVTIRPQKALQIGIVTEMINLPEVHLSRK